MRVMTQQMVDRSSASASSAPGSRDLEILTEVLRKSPPFAKVLPACQLAGWPRGIGEAGDRPGSDIDDIPQASQKPERGLQMPISSTSDRQLPACWTASVWNSTPRAANLADLLERMQRAPSLLPPSADQHVRSPIALNLSTATRPKRSTGR